MDTQLLQLLKNDLDVQLHQLAGNMIFDYTNKFIAIVTALFFILIAFLGLNLWRIKIGRREIEDIAQDTVKNQVNLAKKEIAEYIKQEIGISTQKIKNETDTRIKLFNTELDKKIAETKKLITMQEIKSTVEIWEIERRMHISNKSFYLAFLDGIFALKISILFEPITQITSMIRAILSDMKECLKHSDEQIALFAVNIDTINEKFKTIIVSKFSEDTQKEITAIQTEANSKVAEFKKKQGG